MPRRVSLKDTKKFYYAYKIGKDRQEVYYGEVIEGKGQFTDYNGTRQVNYYGETFEYNATLVLQANNFFIDKFTKIWLGIRPNDNKQDATYKITGISDIKDGLFILFLKSNVPNSDTLWIEYDGKILEIDTTFDYENKIAKIPKNVYCPIDYLTKVWYNKPNDINSVEDLIKLSYKEVDGDYLVLTFEEV